MQTNTYNPGLFLDMLIGKLQLKNDAALAKALEVTPPQISKIRNLKQPVGATILIRAHEVTGLSIRDLRDLMGDRRSKYRTAGMADRREAVAA